LRILNQRTKNNEDLRVYHKNTNYEEKTKYHATIKKEKLQSWKEYCNLTPGTNPLNNLLSSIKQNKEQQNLQNLAKSDGSLTSDLNETVKVMIGYLIPKDETLDDTYYHKRIRAKSKNPF